MPLKTKGYEVGFVVTTGEKLGNGFHSKILLNYLQAANGALKTLIDDGNL